MYTRNGDKIMQENKERAYFMNNVILSFSNIDTSNAMLPAESEHIVQHEIDSVLELKLM
jgi:hypothetical protein